MNYPKIINLNRTYDFYKSYEIKIVERNCIYPFTHMYYYKNDNCNNTHNNFIKIPSFTNLILDKDGLPFIPINN